MTDDLIREIAALSIQLRLDCLTPAPSTWFAHHGEVAITWGRTEPGAIPDWYVSTPVHPSRGASTLFTTAHDDLHTALNETRILMIEMATGQRPTTGKRTDHLIQDQPLGTGTVHSPYAWSPPLDAQPRSTWCPELADQVADQVLHIRRRLGNQIQWRPEEVRLDFTYRPPSHIQPIQRWACRLYLAPARRGQQSELRVHGRTTLTRTLTDMRDTLTDMLTGTLPPGGGDIDQIRP